MPLTVLQRSADGEVAEQARDHRAVAEHRRQDGRPEQRPETLVAQDVHDPGDDEAACGKGHAPEKIETDPQPPGCRVVECGG